MRTSRKPGFTLNHPKEEPGDVQHTGGRFNKKISAEKKEADYRLMAGKRM